MTFTYTKEMLFDEWKVAKEADTKLGKGDDNKVHTNRIKLLKEYVELKNNQPEVFEDININFDNLLVTYQSADPRAVFYKKVFNKSYEEVAAESKVESMRDYEKGANIKELEETIG